MARPHDPSLGGLGDLCPDLPEQVGESNAFVFEAWNELRAAENADNSDQEASSDDCLVYLCDWLHSTHPKDVIREVGSWHVDRKKGESKVLKGINGLCPADALLLKHTKVFSFLFNKQTWIIVDLTRSG